MNQKTSVTDMRVRERSMTGFSEDIPLTEPTDYTTHEKCWTIRFFHADRLVRNFAVAGALMLTIIAVKNSTEPQAQSVFSTLQASVNMEWDESIGKLSFVNKLFPEEIQVVWNEQESISVYAPVRGQTVHAWSRKEPYVAIHSSISDIRSAADGEVMSIAHGLNEERIIRIRHEDASETIYGNVQSSYVEVGDLVHAGEIIGSKLEDEPLVFELRINGRSVDPVDKWLMFDE